MVILNEVSTKHKELFQTLLPIVQRNAKPSASTKAVFDAAVALADILEQWDFAPRELVGMNSRQFTDLVNSWRREASAQDAALMRAAF